MTSTVPYGLFLDPTADTGITGDGRTSDTTLVIDGFKNRRLRWGPLASDLQTGQCGALLPQGNGRQRQVGVGHWEIPAVRAHDVDLG